VGEVADRFADDVMDLLAEAITLGYEWWRR
jgi:hypothetical protein